MSRRPRPGGQPPDGGPRRASGEAGPMSSSATGAGRAEATGPAADNTVRLQGRVTTAAVPRELPSGTLISTFRVSVPRSATAMTRGSTQTSDWVDCVAWSARARSTAGAWQVGDVVEVHGALRRRFFRGATGAATRLEVEMLRGRRARGDRS